MNKLILMSSSDMGNARDTGVDHIWYTVIDEYIENGSYPQANHNPWNNDVSEIEAKGFLMDDCVVILRPARYENRIERCQDKNKGLYFIEIMNQDGSIKYSSRRIYEWDKAILLSHLFKDTSFTTAVRVWKSKKL